MGKYSIPYYLQNPHAIFEVVVTPSNKSKKEFTVFVNDEYYNSVTWFNKSFPNEGLRLKSLGIKVVFYDFQEGEGWVDRNIDRMRVVGVAPIEYGPPTHEIHFIHPYLSPSHCWR